MQPQNLSRPLVLLCACSMSAGCAEQPPEAAPDIQPVTVAPEQVEILSVQVSKLERDQFGHGKMPGTKRRATFWLANSGTALYGRFRVDRTLLRCDEKASRLAAFSDKAGRDLTAAPEGQEINPSFSGNKPLEVELSSDPHEGRFIVRGYRTPTPGATELRMEADLVCTAGSDRRTAVQKDVSLKPGASATAGPVRLSVISADELPGEFKRRIVEHSSRPFDRALVFQPTAIPIETVEFVAPTGKVVQTVSGRGIPDDHPLHVVLRVPETSRVDVRVTYYEDAETIRIPLQASVRLGL